MSDVSKMTSSPEVETRSFWRLVGYAALLGVVGGIAGMVFLGVIGIGASWYGDPGLDWFDGPVWWIGVAAIAGLIVLGMGENPLTALRFLVFGAFGYVEGIGYTLYYTTNFVFTGLAVAVAFNYLFPWRRYPAWLVAVKATPPDAEATRVSERAIDHADLVAALSQIDSIIDVSEQDLLRIYQLATGKAELRQLHPGQIVLGHYYSNDEGRDDWSVRQIVDEAPNPDPEKDMVVYKVVAGAGLRTSGVEARVDFARWARHELTRDNDNWKRVDS